MFLFRAKARFKIAVEQYHWVSSVITNLVRNTCSDDSLAVTHPFLYECISNMESKTERKIMIKQKVHNNLSQRNTHQMITNININNNNNKYQYELQ